MACHLLVDIFISLGLVYIYLFLFPEYTRPYLDVSKTLALCRPWEFLAEIWSTFQGNRGVPNHVKENILP